MKKVLALLKKELMLTVSVIAAIAALIITPPSWELFSDIDWRTLGTLFMMLTVLEGFKKENIFRPLLKLAGNIRSMAGLSLFLVFSVFFSSMFVTNDVSLIIFVPLTIILFRAGGKERYILPVISMENIAAVRGSLLTPFGSPQNLFIYGQSGVSAWRFISYMFPIWILSGVLLVGFVLFLYRRNVREKTEIESFQFIGEWKPQNRVRRTRRGVGELRTFGTIDLSAGGRNASERLYEGNTVIGEKGACLGRCGSVGESILGEGLMSPPAPSHWAFSPVLPDRGRFAIIGASFGAVCVNVV